jgi:hypothetical protein
MYQAPTHGRETLAHDGTPFIIAKDTHALVESLPRTVGIASRPADMGWWVARIVRDLVDLLRIADCGVYMYLRKFRKEAEHAFVVRPRVYRLPHPEEQGEVVLGVSERKKCDEVVLISEYLLAIIHVSLVRRDVGKGRHTSRLLPMMLGTNSCNISSIHAGWKNLLVVSATKPIWYVV